MDCDHIGKVVKDGYNLINGQMQPTVLLWGCTKCDITSPEPLYDMTANFVEKKECEPNCDCFGCKARGLQMNTGDAGRPVGKKEWEGRLKFYKDARNQGIQPAGTQRLQVEAAYKASETLGTAYDAGTMGVRADKVTKSVASIMKETGAA